MQQRAVEVSGQSMAPKAKLPKWLWGLAVFCLLLLANTGTASAVPFLDFTIPVDLQDNGLISYDGSVGGSLIGQDIVVGSVFGSGTPENSGVELAISNGVFNFTTGGFLDGTDNIWNFAGGGSLSVMGEIPGITTGSELLLSGTFNSAQVIKNPDGSVAVLVAFTLDVKNPELLKFYGFEPGGGPFNGTINLSFTLGDCDAIEAQSPAFCSSAIGSGDIINAIPVAEPSTMFLFGSALLLLPLLLRRGEFQSRRIAA